jgi:hypothetical protein
MQKREFLEAHKKNKISHQLTKNVEDISIFFKNGENAFFYSEFETVAIPLPFGESADARDKFKAYAAKSCR